MMSFYAHDDDTGFTTYGALTQVPRSSSRLLEPPPSLHHPIPTPASSDPRGLRNTSLVKFSFSSPSSTLSSTSCATTSPLVSHPEDVQLPQPPLVENCPCTQENQLLTPPASSRSLRTPVAPHITSPHVPTTLQETCDLITAFINSGHTRPLSIPLTDALWSDFLNARDSAAHDSNPLLLHLRFTYDASTSTLITRCMPSPIHDAAQGFFERRLKRLIVERGLSYVDSTRFAIESGTDVGRFTGKRAGSRKQPDVAVVPWSDDTDDGTGLNGDFPLVAVEVGFSEGYEGLVRDMELWLVGSEGKVRVVVLFRLLETPMFQSHRLLTDDDDGGGEDVDAGDEGIDEEIHNTHDNGNAGDDEDVTADVNNTHGNADDKPSSSASPVTPSAVSPPTQPLPYGPYLHNGRILAGQITGFLELWRLDPTTALPVRTLHRNIFPAGAPPYADDTFELTMLDLFGWPDRVPQGCAPDEAVVFDLAEYREVVAKAVSRFARLRLDKVEKERRKMREEAGDDGEGRAGRRRRV